MLLEFFLLLHVVGLAWGLGGATIATIVSMKTEKDPALSFAAMKILPAISKIIWLGIIFLFVSGIGLQGTTKWPIDNQLLLIKHLVVLLIVIIGVFITLKMKKLGSLAPKPNKKPSIAFFKTKKQLKIASTINLLLWYLITILSVLL